MRGAVIEALGPEFHVIPAADTTEALIAGRLRRPHVVLVDLTLSGPGGREFIERYRAEGGAGRILVFTAGMEGDDVARALQLDGVIPKPFEVDQLIATIRALARR